MKSLTLRTRVAADGTVDLRLPCDWPLGNTEVLVVVQPVEATAPITAEAAPAVRSAQGDLPRRISLAEASQMAHRILLDAEQARLRFAVEEADKGIDWERLP